VAVDFLKERKLLISLIAVIARDFTDDRVVFLFDEAVIVLAIGSGSGEGNPLDTAVAQEFVVNELSTIVGVDAKDGKGELATQTLQGGKDMTLGLVLCNPRFGPGSGNIGRIERLDEVTIGRAAVVGNEIDFDEPRGFLVPIAKGPDGDLTLQQGPWLGRGSFLIPVFGPGWLQKPIDGCRANGDEFGSNGWVWEAQLTTALKCGQSNIDEGAQTFSTESIGDSPDLLQDGDDGLIVEPRFHACLGRNLSTQDNLDAFAVDNADVVSSPVMEDVRSVTAAVASELDKLGQEFAPLALGGTLVAFG